MKTMQKTLGLLTLGFVLFSAGASANGLKVKRVTVLGPMKHKVIYQSQELKKTKSKSVYTGKLVAKWGEHVYEVVKGSYECKASVCELVDYTRLATFESCTVRKDKVSCKDKISGDTDDFSGNSNDDIVYENPDEVSDSLGNSRSDEFDYGERSSGSVYDEFGDLYN